MKDLSPILRTLDYTHSLASVYIPHLMLPIMSMYKVKTCIEIGCYDGFLTKAIADGLAAVNPDGSGVFLCCDIQHNGHGMALRAVEDANIQFKFIRADSTEVDWQAELESVGRSECDLASIDGDHEAKARIDIRSVAAVTKHLGFMFLHDYAPGIPDVLEAGEMLVASGEWGRILIPEVWPENVVTGVLQKISMNKHPNTWHRLEP